MKISTLAATAAACLSLTACPLIFSSDLPDSVAGFAKATPLLPFIAPTVTQLVVAPNGKRLAFAEEEIDSQHRITKSTLYVGEIGSEGRSAVRTVAGGRVGSVSWTGDSDNLLSVEMDMAARPVEDGQSLASNDFWIMSLVPLQAGKPSVSLGSRLLGLDASISPNGAFVFRRIINPEGLIGVATLESLGDRSTKTVELGEGMHVIDFKWSSDSQFVAINVEERLSHTSGLYLYAVSLGSTRRLMQVDPGAFFYSWRRDGKGLLAFEKKAGPRLVVTEYQTPEGTASVRDVKVDFDNQGGTLKLGEDLLPNGDGSRLLGQIVTADIHPKPKQIVALSTISGEVTQLGPAAKPIAWLGEDGLICHSGSGKARRYYRMPAQ